MVNDREEIYLRVSSDLQFMWAIFDSLILEADSFSGKMLRERISLERETVRLEKERAEREAIERQVRYDEEQERKDAL